MRSNSSARASLLAATSLAAYKTFYVSTICPKKEIRYSLKGRHQCLQISLSQAKIPTKYISEEVSIIRLAQASRLTRPTPSEMAAENAYRTFTVGINHFVNLSSPLRAWSNCRIWS